jgi:hypothetical protein
MELGVRLFWCFGVFYCGLIMCRVFDLGVMIREGIGGLYKVSSFVISVIHNMYR